MSQLKDILAGKFIVIDGPDGAGKSTQLGLLAETLTAAGGNVESLIDPGSTAIGQKIRSLLLDRHNGEITGICETLLFMACRAQLVWERVQPALQEGKTVLCDRFVSATMAYQGALGVDLEEIRELANVAIKGIWPDLTIILDIPPDKGMKRIGIVQESPRSESRNNKKRQLPLFGDRLEIRTSQYHRRVREAFRTIHEVYPAKVAYVSGDGAIQEVSEEIVTTLKRELSARDNTD